MKPIYQTEFGKYGNCYSACLASITEIDLDSIPNFTIYCDKSKWFEAVRKWTRYYLRCDMLCVSFRRSDKDLKLHGYWIASGPTCSDTFHSVVMLDDSMVHDPDPYNMGIISIYTGDVLVPIDIVRGMKLNKDGLVSSLEMQKDRTNY